MSEWPSFPGTTRFEVRHKFHDGHMGAVYRVYDREDDRDVVLKTMLRPGPKDAQRIKNEFRSRAESLVHENLVQFNELFVEEKLCFFTMEFVEGRDFMSWVVNDLGIARGWTNPAGESPVRPPDGAPTIPGSDGTVSTQTNDTTEGADVHAGASSELGPVPEASWARLRGGIAQIVHGLHALHRVHRDVKPDNMLVTQGDRVVLLDFGLATELLPLKPAAPGDVAPSNAGSDVTRSGSLDGAGAPAYMAPEQINTSALTRAADLYALGVMLYQALAGTLPFTGRSVDIKHAKLCSKPQPVHALAPGAPLDLADLAMDLLARSPEQRPTAAECIDRLKRANAGSVINIPRLPPPASFVGRKHEMDALTAALSEVTEQRRQVTVHVLGASGMGKSTLLREFLDTQKVAPRPLILRGRCHPEESVPFKALDAVVDELAHHFEALLRGTPEMPLPEGAHALVRLFPVFGKVDAFRDLVAPPVRLDAIELRQHGARALREIFSLLSTRRPLIVWLDDVQWGDLDSAPLLDELLRAPAPPFLLLLTYRVEDRERSPLLQHLREGLAAGAEPPAREVALGALGSAEVAELAGAFVELDASGPDTRIEALMQQSEGNPFIACELARSLAAHPTTDGAPASVPRVDVAELILRRVEKLQPAQRSILDIVAVAGKPLARTVALAAAGLQKGARTDVVGLRNANLVREVAGHEESKAQSATGAPSRSENAVGMYHDRIREAVLAAMPAQRRTESHRHIAEALTDWGSDDLEALLVHWEGAGERSLAGGYAVRSAERAALALAFDHAATLYEKSLELAPGVDRPTLLEKLGEVLANRGRAPEAAKRFLEAAAALGEAKSRRVHDLKRRAAEQYIKSGKVDEGWHEMRSILGDVGIAVPGSVLGAMGAAAWRRVAFLRRSIDVQTHSFVPPPPEEGYRMDVLWSASTGWAMINHTLADLFRVMHLLQATKTADASTLCRALAYEAAMEAHLGGRFFDGNARELMDKVRYLVHRTGESYDRAWLDLANANVAYTQGRWRETADACARADDLFRERCLGSSWERVTVAIFFHHALAMLGELPRLAARLDEFRDDAALRGDVYATCEAYVNEPVIAWLAQDKAEEARARATNAIDEQTPKIASWPQTSYRRQHFADLVANVYASAYRADPWPAWEAAVQQWPKIKAAFLLPLRITGLGIRHARARAALAAAATLPDDRTRPPAGIDGRWTRRALVGDAREQLAAIAKDPAGCAAPIADLVRAGLAHLGGKSGDAQTALERAVATFDREEMGLYREAARYALGELHGGSQGATAVRRAEAWMREQGVVKPRAMVAAMVPGVGILGG